MIQDTGRGKNSETDAGIDGLSLSPNRPTVPSVSEVGLIATCQKFNIFYSLFPPFRFILQISLVAVLFSINTPLLQTRMVLILLIPTPSTPSTYIRLICLIYPPTCLPTSDQTIYPPSI